MTTAAASSIQHGDINHQSGTVTLHHHHLGSLSTVGTVKNDGNLYTFSSASTENSTEDLILYAAATSSAANETSSMDFLLDDDVDGDIIDGENGGSSRESIANLLDEGLGTSLDGTDEISPSTTHSTLGRNDSGVFSSDESPRSILGGNLNLATLNSSATSNYTSSSCSMIMSTTSPTVSSIGNSSPPTIQLPNCLPTLNSSSSPMVLPAFVSASSSSSSCSTTSSTSSSTTSTATTMTSGDAAKPKKTHRLKNSSPNRQGPQCCLTCGKVFSNASALTKHKLTHSDERKHICSTCGKAFKRQDHLNGHMLTHRNKKPYECGAKGCGKSYCDARSLRRHVESRHGQDILASMTITPNGSFVNSTGTGAAADSSASASVGEIHARHTNESLQLRQPRTTKIRSQSSSSSNDIISALECHPNNLLMDEDMVNCTVLGLSDADLLNSQFESPLEGVVVNCCLDDSTAAGSLDTLGLDMVTDGGEPLDNHDNNKMIAIKMENNNNNHDCTNTMISLNNNNQQQSQQHNHYILPNSPPVGTTYNFDFTKNCVTTTMRSTTQSQLHQLLTQRVSSGASTSSLANNNRNNDTAITVAGANPNLVLNSSPGVSNHKHVQNGGTPAGTDPMTPLVVNSLSQFSKSTNEKELNKSGTVKATRPYTKKAKGQVVSAKCSIDNNGSLSKELKDQLEFIQQIIQQTKAEEDANNSTESGSGTNGNSGGARKNSTKGLSKKVKAASCSPSSMKSDCSQLSDDLSGGGREDKPVECSRCSRRFKNTPALNGHMRLHGGFYNKKDIDGAPRKKDHHPHHHHHHHHKDSSNSGSAPLQTASVSVRALIGEKIHQKRNTSTSSLNQQGFEKPVAIVPAHVNQLSSSSTSTSSPEASQNGFGGNNIQHQHQQQLQQQNPLPNSLNLNSTSSCGSVSEQEEQNDQQQNLQFICEQDYFLMEEEVFNKVSSICPDSFLVGIDETILRSSANTTTNITEGCNTNGGSIGEELGSEWKFHSDWTTGTNNGGVSGIEVTNGSSLGINPRLNILFSSTSSSSCSSNGSSCSSTTTTTMSDHYNKVGNGNGGPFTPLPPLDPMFYPSPTPLSPSLHSQDSPSFIYPTPPASLESHNLQSPLFPFPSSSTVTTNTASIPSTTQLSSSKNNTTLLYPFETQLNNNNSILIPKTQIQQQQNVDKILAESFSSSDPHDILLVYTTSSADGLGQASLISSCAPIGNRLSGMGANCEFSSAMDTGFTASPMKHASRGGIKVRSCSGSSLSDTLTFLTPSSSPSLGSNVSCGSSASCWGSPDDSAKELKVNEVNRMDRATGCPEGDEIFLNPNSVPASPTLKSPKRKLVRNTFASNLRPHHGLASVTAAATGGSGSHFTPYPILSPVRSAPGLYWQFSPVLSHVDVAQREVPRINIGPDFQVDELPALATSPTPADDNTHENTEAMEVDVYEETLWDPKSLGNCNEEELESYMQFSSCSAIPAGKRDKEYAVHVLNMCNGQVAKALLMLMKRDPELPEKIRSYNYSADKEWSQEELETFEKSLLDFGKDFPKIADKIRTKTSADCVNFYQGWKKKHAATYERIKNIWKKRETAFTLNLLKNVPPPANDNPLFQSLISNLKAELMLESCDIANATLKLEASTADVAVQSNNVQSQPQPPHTHEEFPCRICGKVFSKVKSRSAHMKSHRPPDQNSDGSPNKKTKQNQNSLNKTVSKLMTSPSTPTCLRAPSIPALSPVAPTTHVGDIVSHSDAQS